MMRLLPAVFLCLFSLAGCGNLSSVHRTLDTTQGHGVLIDIKQRAILAATRVEQGPNASGSHSVVCAEPSPDALSAYAFDLAAQGNFSAGNTANATLGSAESAAFVGLRTSSIQLLRDQFFRACEAYMNKAISPAEYSLLIRRYQKQTAALLAIEQLTSVVSPPAAIVSAAGSAQGSKTAFLQDVFNDNKNKIDMLEKAKRVADITDEKKNADQAEIDRLKKQNDDILQSLKNTEPDKVVTTVSGHTSDTTPAANPQDLASVALVVQHIVDNITLTDDFLQLCIVNFATTDITNSGDASLAGRAADADPQNMREACMRRMAIANERLRLQNELSKNYLTSILADAKLTAAEKREQLNNIPGFDSPDSGLSTSRLPGLTDTKSLNLILAPANKSSMELMEKLNKALPKPACDPKKDKDCKQ